MNTCIFKGYRLCRRPPTLDFWKTCGRPWRPVAACRGPFKEDKLPSCPAVYLPGCLAA